MTLVELERVSYRYADALTNALNDITLSIAPGEFVLLAGASGSGKSTLCRLLNGLIPHFYSGTLEGNVCVDGLDTRAHSVAELFAHVGMVFQNAEAQLFNSTVEREIIFGLESLGLPRDEIRARVEWALELTQLTSLRARAPFELSGGEQQAVVIAAMLALRPRLLVLDEPYAHLDAVAVARVRAILRDARTQGTTIIVTEHRLHTTLADATRLIVMADGRIVRDGTPREVLREDVSVWRLNVPYVVQLAQRAGWRDIPLSVSEAVALARVHGNVPPTLRRIRNLPTDVREHGVSQENDPWFFPSVRKKGNGQNQVSNAAPRVIEMRAVHYWRGERAVLRDVSFEVARGESLALIGRNGAGKTTLLKLLNGLLVPSHGYVRVMEQDTRHTRVSTLARMVGIAFQNPNAQFFKTRVRDEIEVAPRALHRLDRAWLEQLCDWFELQPLLERSPFTLSEGEKKRVAIVATLAARPEILVLDEPTTGQDAVFRAALVRVLRELHTRGMTLLVATHDLELADQVASRWLVLHEGMLLADATPDQVMGNEVLLARTALTPTAQWRFQHEWQRATPLKTPQGVG